ncbi:hypothetical protein [Aliikangiella coralliicola]|uniref:Transmembrane protein n=1 Tax=Aliikangiella coralliicola TaxID=2592383 RepID=A0A545TSL8_9GAMM|nr:hypothetical protein [Aliikangiella coralliicola]TQV80215.1 hypothetical protein FLL46_26210 [Aliikangiella coralliicola]
MAISVTFYYSTWLVSPSYNFMVLIGCLLVSASAIRIVTNGATTNGSKRQESSTKDYFYISLIIAGLHLCFVSKPPSALLLYVLVTIVFFSAYVPIRAISKALIVGLAWLALFLIHVSLFDGSLNIYLDRISLAWELNSLLNSTLEPSFILNKFLFYLRNILSKEVVLIIGVIALVVGYIKYRLSNVINLPMFIKDSEASIKLVAFIGVFILIFNYKLFYGSDVGKGGVALLFFLVAWYWLFETKRIQKECNQISNIEILACLIWLFSCSMAFSIGSTIHPILKSSHSLIFCVGCLCFIIRVTNFKSATIKVEYLYMAAILLMITLNINYAQLKPYRLITPIAEQNTKVLLPIDGEPHKVDTKTAKYINDLSKSAKKAEWKEGMVLLDLTGGTPFASYFLKAKVIVTPWYFGGRDNSEQWLRKVLSHADTRDLNSAWLLLAPKGHYRFDKNILFEIEGYKNIEYEKVGSFTSGFRNEQQELWKPKKNGEPDI